MNVLRKPSQTPKSQRPSVSTPEPDRPAIEPSESTIKLLLVEFRSGEAVERHPSVESWVEDGWEVRSAVPRVVESGETKLLVVLEKKAASGKRSPLSLINAERDA